MNDEVKPVDKLEGRRALYLELESCRDCPYMRLNSRVMSCGKLDEANVRICEADRIADNKPLPIPDFCPLDKLEVQE